MPHAINAKLGLGFRSRACGGSALLLALLGSAASAATADLQIVFRGLRSDQGEVLVAVCTEATFLGRACPRTARASASAGVVVLRDVPVGRYAVQAVHDENTNGDLDRSGLLPEEGIAFSRDAPMRFGPPRFGDAAFDLRAPGASIDLRMRYFN